MNPPLRVRALRIHRLQIPMRLKFEHAAAVREVADPIVISLTGGAPYATCVGYGETLARPYVTGESVESVVEDLRDAFAARLEDFRPTSFSEALEFIEELPFHLEGRVVTAARTAVELALLDLSCRAYHRRPADVAGWLGTPGFGPPGARPLARYSGIAVGRTRAKLRRWLRLQRWAGLRDFKLKVAVDGWEERLAWAAEVLRPTPGRVTLRVDANGGWSLAEATEALPVLEQHGVCVLEQPLPETHDDDLPYLAERTSCALMADESLLTVEDAQRLIAAGGVRVFNVRIAKHGGLLPALRIAGLALTAGLDVQLGCLVGETSILSAAGVAFLEICPRVRFVEGSYGRFLLKDDVCRGSVHFGLGGRMAARRGRGLGVEVDPERVTRLTPERPVSVSL